MILIVDGSNMAFRAHCAYPPLNDPEGNPCSAIFGTLKLLRTLVASYPEASRVVVTFDTAKSAYRKGLFPEYKAQRSEPGALDRVNRAAYNAQLPNLIAVVSLLVNTATSTTLEADDIVAWLAASVDPENVVVSSTDKDLYQLVSPRVKIVDAFRRETDPTGQCEITTENFLKVTGVPIHQYIDARRMIGDKSDNIKGIIGIGPVKSAKLLAQYGSIEKMYEAKFEKVLSNKEQLDLNLNLLKLDLHTKQPKEFEPLKVKFSEEFAPNYELFLEALEILSFRSLVNDFNNWVSPFRLLSTAPILNNCDDCQEMDTTSTESVPSISSP